MKYDIKNYNDSEFLVTFIKMLRFAYNNNNGNVDILRCASALGVSFEIIFSLLDLLEELNFINIQEKNYKFYKIKLLEIKNLNIILENNRFEEIKNLITECKNFQRNLMENDLSSLEIV